MCRVEFSPFSLLIVSALSPCPPPPALQQHHIIHPALRPPAPLSANRSFLLRGGLWCVQSCSLIYQGPAGGGEVLGTLVRRWQAGSLPPWPGLSLQSLLPMNLPGSLLPFPPVLPSFDSSFL